MKKVAIFNYKCIFTKLDEFLISQASFFFNDIVVFIMPDINENTFDIKKRKMIIDHFLDINKLNNKVKTSIITNSFYNDIVDNNNIYLTVAGISDINYHKENKKVFFINDSDYLKHNINIKEIINNIGWQNKLKNNLSVLASQEYLIYFLKNNLKNFNIYDEKELSFVDFCISQYKLNNRNYHNLEHIIDMFAHLNWYMNNFNIFHNTTKLDLKQLILAIFAHDCIYNQKDNKFSDEELSAKKLKEFLPACSLAYELVLSTNHIIENTYKFKYLKNHKFLFDLLKCLDLAVLASNKEIYSAYKKNIRLEYSFVNDKDYLTARKSVLNKLFNKQLFPLLEFNLFEQKAKENIKLELESIN